MSKVICTYAGTQYKCLECPHSKLHKKLKGCNHLICTDDDERVLLHGARCRDKSERGVI